MRIYIEADGLGGPGARHRRDRGRRRRSAALAHGPADLHAFTARRVARCSRCSRSGWRGSRSRSVPAPRVGRRLSRSADRRRAALQASARRSSPRCRRSPSPRASINLGQGFPDVDGPAEVAEAAIAAIRAGHNQYPPGPGIPELRAAIAAHQRHWYGLRVRPRRPRCSSRPARPRRIAAALLALCEPGDEVVVFEPYYDSYAACIAMAGGVRRAGDAPATGLRASTPTSCGGAVTPPHAARCCSTRRTTRPARCSIAAELDVVAAVCVEHDLRRVTDEVYEHLTSTAPSTCRSRRCRACASAR